MPCEASTDSSWDNYDARVLHVILFLESFLDGVVAASTRLSEGDLRNSWTEGYALFSDGTSSNDRLVSSFLSFLTLELPHDLVGTKRGLLRFYKEARQTSRQQKE